MTILTSFLGSGNTTSLNHILKTDHGHRIAVIEKAFGEAGIDKELLVQARDEPQTTPQGAIDTPNCFSPGTLPTFVFRRHCRP